MRVNIRDIQRMKRRQEKIVMLTAYDYPSAHIVEAAGVKIILVGDSLAQVVLGYESTIPVTMDMMLHHTKAVVRGTKNALIVGDLPFLTYNLDQRQALENAGRFLQEAGAQAVKLEGGVGIAPTVRHLTRNGIPVMGHIGLTPQSVHQLGGYRVQGRSGRAAESLLNDAQALEEAGAFAVVLEVVPTLLAELITQRVSIPTIGIGAGPNCDGQVQVLHDMLGWNVDFMPKHAKRYTEIADITHGAISRFMSDVHSGDFPTAEQSFTMDEDVIKNLKGSQ
jgi:3-methyl-2-oxobutanoate hydroxymethyltransferase